MGAKLLGRACGQANGNIADLLSQNTLVVQYDFAVMTKDMLIMLTVC